MDNKKIGLYIAELRKEKNMTQKELGEKLFVSDKAVSKWERGLCMPDISLIEKLANVLDASISEILKGEKLIKITKKNSDEIVKESIPFFQKKYFQKKITRIGMGITLLILIGYFIILYIGEATYGSLSWRIFDGEYSIDLPSFSLIVAKNNTKKFLKAFKNYDYDTIEKMARPTEWSFTDTSKTWIDTEEYINILKEIEEAGVKLIKYKDQYCYHNYSVYVCNYSLTFEYNDEKYTMTTDILNYRDAVNMYGMGSGNDKNNSLSYYKLGNSKLFFKFWIIFNNY